MRLGHTTGKTWYKVLNQHTVGYVCNKFIKHFNKNKFETNNMGRIKMNTLYNTVRETTFCAWRHVISCSTFTDVTLLFDHFQCHCSQSTMTFYFRNVDRTVAGNIECMSLQIRMCLRCLHWCIFPHSGQWCIWQSSSECAW